MAQYGINYYGLSDYGSIGANVGKFTSNIIDISQYNLTNIKTIIKHTDPTVEYKFNENIFNYDGNWQDTTIFKESISAATAVIYITCRNLYVKYKGNGAYTVKKFNQTTSTYDTIYSNINISSSTVDIIEIPINEFGLYEITLSVQQNFELYSVMSGISEVYCTYRLGDTEEAVKNSNFQSMNISKSSISDGVRTVEFQNISLNGEKYIQFCLTVKSSDNAVDIYVKSFEIISGTQDKYVKKATYSETVFMGDNFVDYDSIEYGVIEPTGTKCTIRSALSSNSNINSVLSPAYTNLNVVMLNKNKTYGYLVTQEYDIKYLTKILSIYTKIFAQNSNTSNNLVNFILLLGNNEFRLSPKTDIYNIVNQNHSDKFKLKIELMRSQFQYSPRVGNVIIKYHCYYDETVQVNGNFTVSTVENPKYIIELKNISFPNKENEPTKYTIDYSTDKYILYFASTSGINRTHVTTIDYDKIIAESKMPVYISYRNIKLYYNPTGYDRKIKMNNILVNPYGTTDSILKNNGNTYLYKVINGNAYILKSDEKYEIYVNEQTISSTTNIFFDSTDNQYTTMSTINGSSDNDYIIFEDNSFATKEESEWVSDELIYDCSVNINGQKLNLIIPDLKLPTIPTSVAFDEIVYNNISDNDTSRIEIGPYIFEIMPGTTKRILSDGNILNIDNDLIKIKSLNLAIPSIYDGSGKIKPEFIVIENIKRGELLDQNREPTPFDVISNTVYEDNLFIGIWSSVDAYNTGAPSPYTKGVDYIFEPSTRRITWISQNKPNIGSVYYAVYVVAKPEVCAIELSCDYYDTLKSSKPWKSIYYKEIKGETSPENIYKLDVSTLYPINEEMWPDIDNEIDDNSLEYFVSVYENPFVNAYIENNILNVTTKIDSRKHWIPTINNGFYYINKDEYYLANNMIEQDISNNLPNIQNAEFSLDKASNDYGMLVHDKINNFILNSSFELLSDSTTIYLNGDKNILSSQEPKSKAVI